MDNEIENAIAELKAQGIAVTANTSGGAAYTATAPNDEKYQLSEGDLLALKARGELHLEGLLETHLARKDAPDLHEPSTPGRPVGC